MAQERTFLYTVPPPGARTTVGTLIRLLKTSELKQISENKRVRLIALGKLLSDENATLQSLGITNGTFIHVSLTDLPTATTTSSSSSSASSSLNNNAATNNTNSSSSSADSYRISINLTTNTPNNLTENENNNYLMGFDRLRLIGLETEAISILRSQFLNEVTSHTLPSVTRLPDETEAHRLLRAEEIWMRSQPENSEFAANIRPVLLSRRGLSNFYGSSSQSTNDQGIHRNPPDYHEEAILHSRFRNAESERDTDNDTGNGDTTGTGNRWLSSSSEGTNGAFITGFFFAWVLGIIMLLFAINPQASRKFKLGIFCGVGAHIGTNIYLSLYSDPSSSSDNTTPGGTNSRPVPPSDAAAWSGTNTGLNPVDLNNLG